VLETELKLRESVAPPNRRLAKRGFGSGKPAKRLGSAAGDEQTPLA